ncbi:Chromosome segregation and condensation protein, ScpB OS=Tsukamurella paurometabola (strain ATCC 8368/ DSM / CCUG 35730 / CIP 100753 / JCM 10117 / KCTC 9821 / NBRC 16120 / NCIMB 702349 / NCTC 13040) OX=521096 GN=Tpau_2372 PE=4 SV=1 [Tsukamurella paurometabola]|uniref:Chromosome segregation and condensation protein, ScpB n=1 Tax=Tsukamurella paurometabola (strain ATCC 8368 / DSM 20162 / CCUG 35730 / CIP 100753 / JCM 10117 / KCTC 9821 / NBRC 16120 / NCIMB 702349 / NCTC 13040) TaxID=521096 RepID=D5UQY9_TSUPD|nr:SMC-Scp complex subunit ScpB [Tsukamurella paurometabola]ADG78978.1 chromosome segregation and condensation protein, ScpB [Tsukamurella paurometabola DSM 20162]SUP33674.1 Segregation and condensation protein B [Tsukamurella paurometabola]
MSDERPTPDEPAPDTDAPADLVPDDDGFALVEGMENDELRCALEALLLVIDAPASAESLGAALEEPEERITAELRTWAAELTDRRSGMELRESAEGWRLYSRAEYAPYVERLLLDGVRSKLTRAALETLAVIAYRQPVSRSQVSAVRGVNVDGVMRTLAARGLIAEVGSDAGATTYATTELFLERLGLTSLDELPPLAPLLPEVDVIEDLSSTLDDEPRFAKLGRKSTDVIGFDPDA